MYREFNGDGYFGKVACLVVRSIIQFSTCILAWGMFGEGRVRLVVMMPFVYSILGIITKIF